MSFQVLDPTNEAIPPLGQPAPRLFGLSGMTIGLISNGKEGSKGFFAHLGQMLREEGAAEIVLRVKSNYSAPADPPIAAEIPRWDAVITGLGD